MYYYIIIIIITYVYSNVCLSYIEQFGGGRRRTNGLLGMYETKQ